MGTANVGPQASKASSREEGMARLQANVSRDPTKPPDLGALGTRLALQRSGVGTAAVPFPNMSEQDLMIHFPDSSQEQAKEMLRLQTQNEELLKQLQQRRRDLSRTSLNSIGETVLPSATGKAHTYLKGDTWKVEFHDGSLPIHVDCEAKEKVHIRGCRGLDTPVQIYIEGIADLVYIEDCANVSVIIECVLHGLSVNRSVNIDLIVASEVPDIGIRDSKGCELTLCPDNMDGGIETVRSGNVSLHCVFRKGIIALEPEDLLSAQTKYTAMIPCRIITRNDSNAIVHECRANGHLPNSSELFWSDKAAELTEALPRTPGSSRKAYD